ncbi:PREDICTED: ubiquitin carboxyl-terminal hydrolase 18-like [Fragaria vesca subsp. vesca]|uniref:ubiquitin carboxyl-terminal hydrolase 18-like n=1 Tax=Fragaria vesca subsp. vesca TaxID=101020 RepID=UPI0002C377E3|nr:PREDICTED: ubiquitin carboxyl-terminal hydrolase 18-like [Fragaria vesca subsp. vesca]
MHVAGVSLDLNWFLHLIFTLFAIAFVLLHLVKNTASKYFEVDANFDGGADRTVTAQMPGVPINDSACAVCGGDGVKKCSRCKAFRYCSQKCQTEHWRSGHKSECNDIAAGRISPAQNASSNARFKTPVARKNFKGIALVPTHGIITKRFKQPKKILFPYDEFVKLFHWEKAGLPPCGLLNCGNSCFANVVLQCLSSTRPLVAYLLEKGHRKECIRDDWCFLCEFESHLERASRSSQAFSPTNIISRLPNIGGNLGYGRQEDAHELMRFAIDTMQSVCLDEFGGEKAVDPSSQETTIIQHIFGGQLQSQVICSKCNNISNQYENMMDLTVEIHGDASSLEECLVQYTGRESLHGENMYKCDGCNDYVKAWKRLSVKRAPNVLTIALKRFQSGRFGKINKRVTFPATLDLSPYMSEPGDGTDIYSLYGVVVHVDMLNASYFGHYICYTKDFHGNWYRIDDCKVMPVNLEEVLSQGAYMLLYSRDQARSPCLSIPEPPRKEEEMSDASVEAESHPDELVKCSPMESADPTRHYGSEPSDSSLRAQITNCVEASSAVLEHPDGVTDVSRLISSSSASKGVHIIEEDTVDSQSSPPTSQEISGCVNVPVTATDLDKVRGDSNGVDVANDKSCRSVYEEALECCEKDRSSADDMEWESSTVVAQDVEVCKSNGTIDAVAQDIEVCKSNRTIDAAFETTSPVEHPGLMNGNGFHKQIDDG